MPRSLIQSYFEEESTEANIAIIESISDYFKEVKPSINRVTFIIPPFDEDKDKTDKDKTAKHLVKPRFQAYCVGSCYGTFLQCGWEGPGSGHVWYKDMHDSLANAHFPKAPPIARATTIQSIEPTAHDTVPAIAPDVECNSFNMDRQESSETGQVHSLVDTNDPIIPGLALSMLTALIKRLYSNDKSAGRHQSAPWETVGTTQ
ncbi:uncharacterized protein FIESC28_06342 [Fusarium coffeatum]|uniref:Uncharacterized protein n=1 Tax=Fusarium coffeatum TaxID=231269 RepID=A0A366RL95_9HYPO|nr:uncharacterized protein FIESC28_06342 [Fusarium coffeatum]RBR17903.1 hypothetical protein FIESC28_06342 [Fusarium coffeatum]